MDKDRQAAYDYLKKMALKGIKDFDCPEPEKTKGKKTASYKHLKGIAQGALQAILRMEMAEKQREKITEVKRKKHVK